CKWQNLEVKLGQYGFTGGPQDGSYGEVASNSQGIVRTEQKLDSDLNFLHWDKLLSVPSRSSLFSHRLLKIEQEDILSERAEKKGQN
ncbi:hypothetical protein, partial [Klebsiella pneumoniae]|uniref:hypothetical protein n=1 Tax=Klebsiella pneumoniae TaxID=573 RepID=UPI00272FCF3B